MEQFDLRLSTNELLNEFDKISYNGTIAILEWFYKAMNYKIIFETAEKANSLYTRLLGRGYKEVGNAIEELECFKKLMQKTEDDSEERVGYYLISLIMKCLKEHKALSTSLEQFICIYNEVYNKDKTFEVMMNSLKEAINADIVFTNISYGGFELLSGKLEDVEPYQTITIEGQKYPFIGYQSQIKKITDANGKVLYNNSRASTYDILRDPSVIEKKKQDYFGDKYKQATKLVY